MLRFRFDHEEHNRENRSGKVFTVDGLVPDEGSLKQIIFDDISEWKESGVARKVDDLLKTIKLMAYSEDIPLHYDRIHVANGTWYLGGYPDIAGIYGVLHDPDDQSTEDADADRERR